ncbi:DUF2721 domain-containing protein [Xylanivirga thermophila]|jgi:hypothetical protein|uniref:DUF2721 domain-containing protein n=1 Tax=Xylanivirga thermophila TaxID=2496273 RepID=UPI001FB553DA|nr:DUF2721 domain-containing protein [Xylanivirga thermophila]
MKLELTTPALLFTAISLLISAYTSRFLTLAQLLRQLDGAYREKPDKRILDQMKNLSRRIRLIRWMQVMGVLSFILCVLSMFLLFMDNHIGGQISFGISLLSLMLSLIILIYEVQISVDAIAYQLQDYEDHDLKL